MSSMRMDLISKTIKQIIMDNKTYEINKY